MPLPWILKRDSKFFAISNGYTVLSQLSIQLVNEARPTGL